MSSKQTQRDGLNGVPLFDEGWEPAITLRPGLKSKKIEEHLTASFSTSLTNRMIQDEQMDLFGKCNTLVYIRKAREIFNASQNHE